MFKFLKSLYEPIRKGNEYRESLYGKPKSFAENFRDMKERFAKEKLKKIQHRKELEKLSVDPFYYEFHKSWTGARYVTSENPILNYSNFMFFYKHGFHKNYYIDNMLKQGETCTYDPVNMLYFHGKIEV